MHGGQWRSTSHGWHLFRENREKDVDHDVIQCNRLYRDVVRTTPTLKPNGV